MQNNKNLVNPDNYYIVTGWMNTMLHLKGIERDVFAIIYGFTQNSNLDFTATQNYLAQWCGCTVRSIQNSLDKLTEKGYIERSIEDYNKPSYIAKSYEELRKIRNLPDCGIPVENHENTVETCGIPQNNQLNDEKISPYENNDMAKKFRHDDEKISCDDEKISGTHYNIIYNKNNNISLSKKEDDDENFSSKQKRNMSVENHENSPRLTYQQIISSYTESKALSNAIWNYISMRSMIKAPLTNFALEIILEKLDSMADNENQKIKILEHSTVNNYKDIYPLKENNNYQKPSYKNNYKNNSSNNNSVDNSVTDNKIDKYLTLVKKYSNDWQA